MKRREFIGLLGGAALATQNGAFAQPSRTARIGILSGLSADDIETKNRLKAMRDGLSKLGWIEGRNIQIDARMAGTSGNLQAAAQDLIDLKPDVLVAFATTALSVLHKMTTTIPIVFVQVTDPVEAGFIRSLARPGGNITGFTQHEFSVGVKWLELLKQLAPTVEHVALLYDPRNPAIKGYLSAIHPTADIFKVSLSEHAIRDDADVERTMIDLVGKPNGGLIVLPGPGPSSRRDLIVSLAARHRLPAVYPFRVWAAAGGLAFYGVDNIELYRLSASYIDKIIKGEKPGDLPVQHATKFELVINLKTAEALGLELPITLLARTDEVIE